jgi:hypothetical protein
MYLLILVLALFGAVGRAHPDWNSLGAGKTVDARYCDGEDVTDCSGYIVDLDNDGDSDLIATTVAGAGNHPYTWIYVWRKDVKDMKKLPFKPLEVPGEDVTLFVSTALVNGYRAIGANASKPLVYAWNGTSFVRTKPQKRR